MVRLATGLILFCGTALLAQNGIAVGTILPLQLNSSLNSGKAKAGQAISARVMQDVPLPGRSKIPRGSTVIGQIIRIAPPSATGGARLSFRFDTLVISRRKKRTIVTNLRALASMMAVNDAQIPETGPDRGTPPDAWTTVQVGGEVVYRGGGPVSDGLRTVGEPVPDGVLVHVSSKAGSDCRGEVGDNHQPQALWVFSSDACGIYELPGLSILHAGRTDPLGEITIASEKGDVHVSAGSGILLRMIGE